MFECWDLNSFKLKDIGIERNVRTNIAQFKSSSGGSRVGTPLFDLFIRIR